MKVSLKTGLFLSVCAAALAGCGGGGGSHPGNPGGGGSVATIQSNFGDAFAALFNRDANTDAGELDPAFTIAANSGDPIDF